MSGTLELKGSTSGTATFTVDATTTKVTLDKPFEFSAGAVIAASQALTGTAANSTISGFLSVSTTNINPGGVSVMGGSLTALSSFNGLDVQSGGIALVIGGDNNVAGTRTNSTTKGGRIAMAHYTNSQAPYGMFSGFATSTANNVYIGGGFATVTAMTAATFYAAANNTTATGTAVGTVDINGFNGVIGGTTPAAGTFTTGSFSGTLGVTGALTTNGGLVTFGAADSGGAGKRLMLVPN